MAAHGNAAGAPVGVPVLDAIGQWPIGLHAQTKARQVLIPIDQFAIRTLQSIQESLDREKIPAAWSGHNFDSHDPTAAALLDAGSSKTRMREL